MQVNAPSSYTARYALSMPRLPCPFVEPMLAHRATAVLTDDARMQHTKMDAPRRWRAINCRLLLEPTTLNAAYSCRWCALQLRWLCEAAVVRAVLSRVPALGLALAPRQGHPSHAPSASILSPPSQASLPVCTGIIRSTVPEQFRSPSLCTERGVKRVPFL